MKFINSDLSDSFNLSEESKIFEQNINNIINNNKNFSNFFNNNIEFFNSFFDNKFNKTILKIKHAKKKNFEILLYLSIKSKM